MSCCIKGLPRNRIPTKVIKENGDIFADFIHPLINAAFNNGNFLSFLKLANVVPVFKKGSESSKNNHTPISLVQKVSKIFKRIIFKQIGAFLDNVLRKDYIVQKNVLLP